MDDESVQYAKAHRKDFFELVTEGFEPSPDELNAVFMAGSPGAGKSEVAQGLQFLFETATKIDADVFREQFPGYDGHNAAKFQRGSAYLVDSVFDKLIQQRYSFILDGTFAIGKAIQNVERTLRRNYRVTICYVCQDPIIAWQFTQARAEKEGRVVPADRFINVYYESRQNFLKVCNEMRDYVENMIIFKSVTNEIADVATNVQYPELLLPPLYDREKLEGALLP